MRRSFLVLLVAGILASCESLPKDQAHFAKGFDAYKKGDFYTALLYLKPLVEEGHPAAELLMAKMYANGEGVPEDIGKAELLRNLAATKIYRRPYAPGLIRPSNATLKSVQDRLDYYADGANSSKAMPVQDLSQLLTSLDLNSIKRLAATDFENPSNSEEKAPQEVASEAAPESPPPSSESAPSLPQEAERPVAAVAPAALDLSHARNSNHISLTLLRQSANEKDPLAMELLSTAYAKGYYGLTPDLKQAAVWRGKARDAHNTSPSSVNAEAEQEADESLPLYRLGVVTAIGLILLGGGTWLGLKRRRQRIS